jgi:hypothetical protein
MAKKKSRSLFFHIIFLLAGLGALGASLFMPWAKASMLGFIPKIIRPFDNESFQLIMLIPPFFIGMIFVTGIYSFFGPKRFLPGFIIMLLGAAMAALGIQLWMKIEANDVRFLGIDPLKIAEVKPDIGILLIIIGGAIIFLDGFIYLVSSAGGGKGKSKAKK